MVGVPALRPGLILRWRFRFHVAMDEEIVEAAEHEQRAAEPQSEVQRVSFDRLFILPELHAQPAQDRRPARRSDERVQRVESEIHFGDAGGNADQMPDHRQKPCDENSDRAEFLRPPFRAVNFFRGDEKKFSEPQHERASGEA